MNQTVTAAAPAQPQTPGGKIDALFALREKYRALNAEIKELKHQMDDLELEIIAQLDSLDLGMAKGRMASVTVTESEVPTATDWDAIYNFIEENNAPYLLERRISAAAWRELKDAGELLPGTEPFKKRGISLRKL